MFVRKELIPNRPPPASDAGKFGIFSARQWGAFVILDVALKAAIFWLLHPIFFVFLMYYPPVFFYPALLIPVTFLVSFFRLKPVWAVAAILASTSILYIGALTFDIVRTSTAGVVEFCSRVPQDWNCDKWKNGISLSYVLDTATLPLFAVLADVIPFLAVFIYSRWRAGK